MSQDPWAQPSGGWPVAPPMYLRFNPTDALISNDYAGWWSRGFALLRAGWRPMAMLQLILAAPMAVFLVPSEIAYERRERALQASLGPEEFPPFGDMLGSVLILLAGGIPAGLIFAFGGLATVRMVTVIATGGVPQVGEAVRAAGRRLPAMLGWYVVVAAICLVALALCFLPLIYVSAVFTILPAVLQLERGNAISRCFRLFHADLGASIGRAATIGGLSLAAYVMTSVITLVAGLAPSASAVGFVSAVLQVLVYMFSGLVLTPLIVTMYADVRARHEPFSTAYLVDPAPGA